MSRVAKAVALTKDGKLKKGYTSAVDSLERRYYKKVKGATPATATRRAAAVPVRAVQQLVRPAPRVRVRRVLTQAQKDKRSATRRTARAAKPCKEGKTRAGRANAEGVKRCVKIYVEPPCKEGKVRAGKETRRGLKRCIKVRV